MKAQRLRVVDLRRAGGAPDLALDVRRGLSGVPKRLPPVHFYDEKGSALFEEITRAPEYYVTRVELSILRKRAEAIARLAPAPAALVELGSGSSLKTRALIAALLRRQGALRYAAVDVSRSALLGAAPALLRDYPGLSVTAVVGDYSEGLAWLAGAAGFAPKLVLYLGSSLGNFDAAGARALLSRVAGCLGPDDALILGADLRKSPSLILRAYNDAAGATARFNLNLLRRINDELGGRFEPAAFAHRAWYNAPAGKIEMHLESLRRQSVAVAALGEAYAFERGETIHTEDSRKYDLDELQALARSAGLRRRAVWLDERRWFSVGALVRA